MGIGVGTKGMRRGMRRPSNPQDLCCESMDAMYRYSTLLLYSVTLCCSLKALLDTITQNRFSAVLYSNRLSAPLHERLHYHSVLLP